MKKILQKFANPSLFIISALVLRLLPHIPNIAPIAAMALFGGVYLNKKYALVVPLVVLFISDLFLGFYGVPMLFVYSSFFLTGLIGLWLKKHKTPLTIITASLFSSLLFFFITNFGVWLSGGLYPATISGLADCYFMAIPFFRNTLIGDLFYNGLFFIAYEITLRYLKNRTAGFSSLPL